MDNRFKTLLEAKSKNITEYNQKVKAGEFPSNGGAFTHMPYIIVIIDEFADLILTGKGDVEKPVTRLAQLARAVGIHLIIATQRPSVDIITGVIKANFPARISYRVASKVDSRTILDESGAEKLIGRGDLLFSEGSNFVRLQSPYVSSGEIENTIKHITNQF
jgi:DNA segregation ATPase FtsK/SpoIIIE, S-DNA-T family